MRGKLLLMSVLTLAASGIKAQSTEPTSDEQEDVTERYIVNPTLEGTQKSTSINGWTNTYGNMYIQTGGYPLWDEENDCLTSEYGLDVWAEIWSGETCIDPADIHQVIEDLPMGDYTLTADCTASTDLYPDEEAEASGCFLYVITNGERYRTEVGHGFKGQTAGLEEKGDESYYNYPRRYTVTFTHFGGDVTVGFGFEEGFATFIAVDNFKLGYAGVSEDAGARSLSTAIESAQMYADGWGSEYIYSEATYNSLLAELENAVAVLAGGDDDACLAEATVLTSNVNVVREEIEAYANLLALTERISQDIEKYQNIGELSSILNELLSEYTDTYLDKTATVEQIDEWTSQYDAMLLGYIRDAMSEATEDSPVEITILGVNMDYADNSLTEGWTVTTGSAGNSGSYDVSYHTAEVWSNTFSCLQTLDDMPAGAYRLQAKAFYRTSSRETNYTDYINGTDEILTYLVVEDSKAPVVNQAAGAQQASTAPYTGYVETVDGSGIWIPNTMQATEYAFNLDDTYLCEVNGYLTKDGTLTFGIRNDELTDGNGWSIWSQFRLFYSGTVSSQLYDALLSMIAQASALDDQVCALIEAADEKLMKAISDAEELTAGSSDEELQEAYQNLEEAIEYANEGLALIPSLRDMAGTYEAKIGSVESDDTAFPTLLEEIEEAIGNEEFVSNEQMKEWMERLPKAWTAYIQYNALGATEDNPADITAVITNPSFDYGTNDLDGATGWTFEYAGDSGSYYHIGYNTTTEQEGSDYAYEYWNLTAFNMYQTIVGLAEGNYRLAVDAFYRAGSNSNSVASSYYSDPDNARDMDIYANDYSIPMYAVYDFAQEEALDVDGEESYTYGGNTYYVPNTMTSAKGYFDIGCYNNTLDLFVEEGEDLTLGLRLARNVVEYNWCIFDNFALYYLGNPDGGTTDAVSGAGDAAEGEVLAIYDLSGRRIGKAQRGVNIVSTRLSDGTVSTNKVLVR